MVMHKLYDHNVMIGYVFIRQIRDFFSDEEDLPSENGQNY